MHYNKDPRITDLELTDLKKELVQVLKKIVLLEKREYTSIIHKLNEVIVQITLQIHTEEIRKKFQLIKENRFTEKEIFKNEQYYLEDFQKDQDKPKPFIIIDVVKEREESIKNKIVKAETSVFKLGI